MSERDTGSGRDLQPQSLQGMQNSPATGGVSGMNGMDFELLAASLRADASDLPMWIAALGTKLARALPDRVQLQRGGIFGNGAIYGIKLDLGAWRMALRLNHGRPLAWRAHVVRGIALKTEELPLDAWIEALSQALTELAATSARESAAIQSLLS